MNDHIEIVGWEKVSFIDFPGKVCTILFTPGCNFRCPYCHNYELVIPKAVSKLKPIPEEEIFSWLEKRKDVIEAVEITGGEPTLHGEALLEFMQKVKDKGFLVKLDTNGSFPNVLKKAVLFDLVDYVAMDVKAPIEKYPEIAGTKVDTNKIKKSISILLRGKVDYEFRTTAFPILGIEDFEEIGRLVKGAKKYYIQQFRNKHTLSADNVVPYPPSKLGEFAEVVRGYVRNVAVRGI
jgi:pyruvate formate lyase activating enzyme